METGDFIILEIVKTSGSGYIVMKQITESGKLEAWGVNNRRQLMRKLGELVGK